MEAEWEYACRGDTTTPFNVGECLNDNHANYDWRSPITGCLTGKVCICIHEFKVFRGGGYAIDPRGARSAFRFKGSADGSQNDTGIRLVFAP